ncbi:MAG: hypothetical protein JRG89_06995 [Deltaproteobacteria bacterium]|nr:hypothetical protein [Deltaproteobacteria bacterium]
MATNSATSSDTPQNAAKSSPSNNQNSNLAGPSQSHSYQAATSSPGNQLVSARKSAAAFA